MSSDSPDRLRESCGQFVAGNVRATISIVPKNIVTQNYGASIVFKKSAQIHVFHPAFWLTERGASPVFLSFFNRTSVPLTIVAGNVGATISLVQKNRCADVGPSRK